MPLSVKSLAEKSFFCTQSCKRSAYDSFFAPKTSTIGLETLRHTVSIVLGTFFGKASRVSIFF